METSLADRVVVITGGSSGIGRATARAFGRERSRVALTYRTNLKGAKSCAEEVETAGGTAITLPFDGAALTCSSTVPAAVTGTRRGAAGSRT